MFDSNDINLNSSQNTDANIEEPSTKSNEYIDKITLELLLNKNHYNKYLSKTNPKKFEEHKEYKQKLKKYSIDIIDMTSQLIENPNTQFSNEIEESFHIYIQSIFKYFELNELKKANKYYENDEDEDTMFVNMDNYENNHNYDNDNDELIEKENNQFSHSFWGKEKVVKKQSSILDNDLHMMKYYKSKNYFH